MDQSADINDKSDTLFSPSMFAVSQEEFDFYGTVEKFIEFVDKLATVAVMAESDHILLFHYLLTFYELVGSP